MSNANSASQKKILFQKFKITRNQVNSSLRKDSVDFNNNRIEQANDENEVWKVVNDVIQPKKENDWSLKEGDKLIKDEQMIADTFNKFFIEKIEDLKKNINITMGS